MSPAEAAAAALGADICDVLAVEPIKHGLTNESWRVRTNMDEVVVRISTAHDEALRIDRASELAILRTVAAAGLGAPVLYVDSARHTLVTRYLGEPWTRADALDLHNITRLAERVARLHGVAPPSAARRVDLLGTVQGYLQTLDALGVGGELCSTARRERALAAAVSLDADQPCLCHNDLHHLNIVDAAELTLIDWEYAGVGAPSFDLASACVYHEYGPRARERLCEDYARASGRALGSPFDEALWLFAFIRDLWSAVRESV